MNTLPLASLASAVLTSNWVIGIVVGVIVSWVVGTLIPKGKDYEYWIGLALQAVKAAERAIPDETENRCAAKLDYAMRVFIEKYEAATKTVVAPADLGEVENLIEKAVQCVSDAEEK